MIRTLVICLALLFFTCLLLFGCASYQPAVSQSQMDVFARGCNAGFPSSCIVLQQSYEQNRAQIIYNQQADIAAHEHWQNYWLAQQRASDQIYTDSTNQLNFLQNQLRR